MEENKYWLNFYIVVMRLSSFLGINFFFILIFKNIGEMIFELGNSGFKFWF